VPLIAVLPLVTVVVPHVAVLPLAIVVRLRKRKVLLNASVNKHKSIKYY
jgi:hypothetical protein